MKKCIAIKNFFSADVPLSTLGYFRMAVGGFALVQLAFLLPDWSWLYGQKGLVPWEVTEALSTTCTPLLSHIYFLLEPLGVSIDFVVYGIAVLFLLSLAGLTVGYKTRLMAIMAWLLHLIISTTGQFTAYGVETFTRIALFYCMVLPVGQSLSVDALLKTCRPLPPYLVTLSVRLIQFHLCIMYVACGMEKAMGMQWWNGDAIWMALQQDQFKTVDMDWMATFPLVPKLLCWTTLLVETFYPVGIFWQRTKKLWLAAIIGMHLFIGIFLGLHLFATLMILLNLTAFGPHCFAGPAILRKRILFSSGIRRAVFTRLYRQDVV